MPNLRRTTARRRRKKPASSKQREKLELTQRARRGKLNERSRRRSYANAVKKASRRGVPSRSTGAIDIPALTGESPTRPQTQRHRYRSQGASGGTPRKTQRHRYRS